MKKIYFLALLFLLCRIAGAQTVPLGMKYQAVARDLKGNVIANQKIFLEISLGEESVGLGRAHYIENHTIVTNKLGLFDLVIGSGKVTQGTFDAIPWSTQNIWMQVAIKENASAAFTTISNSKLLAVPYAFHAGTASELLSKGGTVAGAAAAAPINSLDDPIDKCDAKKGISLMRLLYLGPDGVTVKVFSDDKLTKLLTTVTNVSNGNVFLVDARNTPEKKFKEQTYLQISTPGLPVSVVPTKGEPTIVAETYGNFSVMSVLVYKDKSSGGLECTACDMNQNWKVGGNVFDDVCGKMGTKSYSDVIFITNNLERFRLTKDGDLTLKNNLAIGRDLTVANDVNIGNDLFVKRNAEIGNDLVVKNNVSLNTTGGNTVINGATILNSTINVEKAATLKSTLNVKDNTLLEKTLEVNGATSIHNNLSVDKNDAGFVASITNTNAEDGDGLKIKLGKAKTVYNAPNVAVDESQAQQLRDLIRCDYNGSKITLLGNVIADGAVAFGKMMAGIAVGAGNMIIKEINNGLNLPLSIPELVVPGVTIPKIEVPKTDVLGLGAIGFYIPAIPIIPETVIFNKLTLLPETVVMPRLPLISGIPGIEPLDITGLDFWGIPNICLSDAAGSSPLNNKNEFIQFADKNNVAMGSIKAVSVSDWSTNYLNPMFLMKLRGALTSSTVDKDHARYHFKSEITTALLSYRKIGVEYSSGNGDYAEWLERKDAAEFINPGDIVGVAGGRITKDLSHAEQVMVVSHNPIMLGNTPEESKITKGNNIAFIGQVPVKVMGPVSSGDYIIGQVKTPGYGIAKHPNKMSIDDYKNVVGRSWEDDERTEAKMVNTVVGVHNNTFINLIKDLKQTTEKNDARLKAIENRLNITPLPKSKLIKNTVK